ncbi:MAG: hypothetical protein QOE90_90 [Thermoplasmata archaeon]|nr:hypothetical protein [Thermoplasmata archaeon]
MLLVVGLVALVAVAVVAGAFALAAGPRAGLLGDVEVALVLVSGFGSIWTLVAIAALTRARARKEPAPVAPRPVPPTTGALPGVEDLEGLPFPLTVCPDCGYPGVRHPGIRDGVWAGGGETGARFVCPRCGFQGIPVEFERREDYLGFLAALRGGAEAG